LSVLSAHFAEVVEVVRKINACFAGIKSSLEDLRQEDEIFEELNNVVLELTPLTQAMKKILLELIQLAQKAITSSMPSQTYFRLVQEKVKEFSLEVQKVPFKSLNLKCRCKVL
jgi:hypothetical protein